MKERILITGGLGFIGHHLTKYLLDRYPGIHLDIVDNLSSTKIDFDWLRDLAEIHIGDFLDFEPTHKYSQIYHLASPVGALGILERNGYIASDILMLTYKVAEMAIGHKARLLFVSSSEIYGHSGVHKEFSIKVVPNKKGTRLEYGLGKLLSEEVLYNLAIENNLQYKICRPFNVFGEYQSSELGFVVPTFFEHALVNSDLPVFLDGKQQRSFCYVGDIVNAMVTVMEKGTNGEIYNIGHDGNTVSILDLAKLIIQCAKSKSGIKFIDPGELYGKKYCEAFDKIPDIEKIKEHTGWLPQADLKSSLVTLVDFYHKKD